MYKFDVVHGSHIIEWGMRTEQEVNEVKEKAGEKSIEEDDNDN